MIGAEAQFAALTDVGRQRDHNEDNFLVDKKLGLFVVCDGMGGHAAGEVASALAVRTLHEEVKRELDLVTDYAAGSTGSSRVTKRDIINMLEFAVNRASSRIHAEAMKDERKRGMGTTLAALLLVKSEAFIVWVGDSRVYHLRGGRISQVTEDHNVYNELVRRKRLTREQAAEVAQKNAVTRAVGVYEHVEPESLVVDVVQGDRFLLCSDGLSGYFEDDIESLGRLLSLPDAEVAVQKLVERANEQGGKDNITAVVITVGELDKRDEERARRLKLRRDTLARMPLFRPLNERELLRVLEVTEVLRFDPGETVMGEGERGEALFIVLTGRLKVWRGGTEIAELGPGDHAGEMALVRSSPRSATVIADSTSELMLLRRSDFFDILRKEHPLAVKLLWQFLGVLAHRLEETSRELGAAKEELAAEDVTNEIFDEDDDEDNRKTALLPPPPSSLRGG
ncbi:MAG TPA: cyclic nucleotide-binding domain-containing protein [Polyangiaceae bacterium]|nr:cyclic nucleotide-binding domain-containing protein [Polyangiaceae bacterium]